MCKTSVSFATVVLISLFLLFQQAGLIEANGELKVFIDQNLSPGKGKEHPRLFG